MNHFLRSFLLILSFFTWVRPGLAAAEPIRAQIRLRPEVRIFLSNAQRTEVELTQLNFRWCRQDSCFDFTPRSIQRTGGRGQQLIRIRGNEGASFFLRITETLVSYRFALDSAAPSKIVTENVRLSVPNLRWSKGAAKPCDATVPDCFHDSHEPTYQSPITMTPGHLIFLPLLLQGAGQRLYIGEMGGRNYAGTYLTPVTDDSFDLLIPRAPRKTRLSQGEWITENVIERHDFITDEEDGQAVLPWRFIALLNSDKDLLLPEDIRALAGGPVVPSSPWITEGFGTDEWITSSQIDLPEEELGFRSGLNTATYKYYIDFAKKHGLRFVHLDAGWSDPQNIYHINPQIDLEVLRSHAQQNGIKLMLWVQSTALRENLREKIRYLKNLGASAIMVDFFNRDDVSTNRFQEQILRATYDQQLMLLMHGVAKITGQDRRWPHLIAWEAGAGHEFNKWSKIVTPQHKLDLLFVRNPIGIFDYEGGGFRNRWPWEFEISGDNPHSQGTRANEIAYYALYDSRIQILAGNLGDYVRSADQLTFLTRIPTHWDEVRPLSAQIDDHVVVAKRAGKVWYLAGASAAPGVRQFLVDLKPLFGPGPYRVTSLTDCLFPSSATCADLAQVDITDPESLSITMSPFGGYLARIENLRQDLSPLETPVKLRK